MSCIWSPDMSAHFTRGSEKLTLGKSLISPRYTQRVSLHPSVESLKKHSNRVPDRITSVTPSPVRSTNLTSGSLRSKDGATRYLRNERRSHRAPNCKG